MIALGVTCVLGSFVLGIETVGDVHPFQATIARETSDEVIALPLGKQGDFDCDGQTPEIRDAIVALELSLGYSSASECQMQASRTGRTPTGDDAVRVLRTLERTKP